MERSFDLREATDREALACYLPMFDGRTYRMSSEAFTQGLSAVATFLNDPEWLIYQSGMLGPIGGEKHAYHVDLERIVVLGHELLDLSQCEGFTLLVDGFFNPSQFSDSLFEARTASIFNRLNATASVAISRQHVVRGRRKRPDFDVETAIGSLSVECKRRHPDKHEYSERLRTISAAIQLAMNASAWPDHLRLEVEILGAIRQDTGSFAQRLVKTALGSAPGDTPLPVGMGVNAYVLAKESPFKITKMQAGHDWMVLAAGKATGLFNASVTKLRATLNDLDKKVATVVGAQIADALKQLPENRRGVIMLGDVPVRIAMEAIDRRIDSPAYDNILAFGLVDEDQLHFAFREANRNALERLTLAGMRPLFIAA
jgi:hypothetical protein